MVCICTSRLFHTALQHVLQPLEKAGTQGICMADSYGNVRNCFPLLAAYLADYPEQVLVNIAPYNASPVTMAARDSTGAPERYPSRTYEVIVKELHDLQEEFGEEDSPTDTLKYHSTATKHGLSAVREPFWEHLPHVQPHIMITPDILHNAHGFFRHHMIPWILELVGKEEFDARISTMPRMIGLRAYPNGISRLKQWTGRDAREVQRHILALVQGSPKVTTKITKALRALLDFIYIAQYQSHSSDTLGYLESALQGFHNHKVAFWKLGARKGRHSNIQHFNIPKLCGFHDYAPSIRQFGSVMQFSTDITEFFHKESTKQPYQATNKRNFMPQMCLILERREKWAQFHRYLGWVQDGLNKVEHGNCDSDNWSSSQSESGNQSDSGSAKLDQNPHQYLTLDVNAAPQDRHPNRIKLTKTPHGKGCLSSLAALYGIPDLHDRTVDFLKKCKSYQGPNTSLLIHSLSTAPVITWKNIRIATPKAQDPDELTKHQTIPADPPSHNLPHGRCGTVLLHWSSEAETAGLQGELPCSLSIFCWPGLHLFSSFPMTNSLMVSGYRVAQIRLLFELKVAQNHPLQDQQLAYVHVFTPLGHSSMCPHSQMYQVSKMAHGVDNQAQPLGMVVEVASIARAVHLIPDYGSTVHPVLNAANCLDLCQTFWVNCFLDKETYQAVY